MIFSQIISPAKAFSTAYYNIRKGMASSERIVNVLNADLQIVEKDNALTIDCFSSEINFYGVNFSYNDQAQVLKGINLKVKKGECIALVGPSGAGKTTLVDLLPRFYDVSSGNITIDGINVKDLKLSDLREKIGFVSQQAILFNDSVYNLSLIHI